MSRRRDKNTLDMFANLKPAPVVARFEASAVDAWSISGRMSRAVGAALKECGMSRKQVAVAMAEFLDEDVPESMLDAYSSQGKDKHQITAVRLLALVKVTKDARVINALLNEAGLIAVPVRYEALIKREMANEAITLLERERSAADAQWKASK